MAGADRYVFCGSTGVSATSLIRQFDPMTPIISMTSNSGPNDIMTYFSHGSFPFPSYAHGSEYLLVGRGNRDE